MYLSVNSTFRWQNCFALSVVLILVAPEQALATPPEYNQSLPQNLSASNSLLHISLDQKNFSSTLSYDIAHCCQSHSSYPYDRYCCHSSSKDTLVPSYPSSSYVPSYKSRSYVPSYERNTSSIRGSSRSTTVRAPRRATDSFTGRR